MFQTKLILFLPKSPSLLVKDILNLSYPGLKIRSFCIVVKRIEFELAVTQNPALPLTQCMILGTL